MIIVLDLNENESKEWHEMTDYLDFYGKLEEYEDATPSVYRELGKLVYKSYKKGGDI